MPVMTNFADRACLTAGAALCLALSAGPAWPVQSDDAPRWLAGDHHVHSRYSVSWDESVDPPAPVLAGDARYAIWDNAERGRSFGLDWMVATDHGGPNHSRLNYEIAYPELLESRRRVPEVIQFWGMEFDTPGAQHSSLIIPHSPDEAEHLRAVESQYSRREPWPADPAWDTEARMTEALEFMRDELPLPPIVISNHPGRSAPSVGAFGNITPAELRAWNDTAPDIAIGMEGAPGHQARAINPAGEAMLDGERGGYRRSPTWGGFDPLTAQVGGFWDFMLGEGRHWWVTATSDSHTNWRDGGGDFWPGEYAKTYVFARHDHASIMDALRSGRIFVTTGDLIDELDVVATDGAGRDAARIGETLSISPGSDVRVRIRFRDPDGDNAHGDNPAVSRLDVIAGPIAGRAEDGAPAVHDQARVAARFDETSWGRDGERVSVELVFEDVQQAFYVRVRGTNTGEMEPEPDPPGEDPWSDLWFYANPVFVEVRPAGADAGATGPDPV